MTDSSRTVLADRTYSSFRTVAGTEHPIVDQLVRDRRGVRKATYEVVRGLCNGVAASCTSYATLREARAAFDGVDAPEPARRAGRTPRGPAGMSARAFGAQAFGGGR